MQKTEQWGDLDASWAVALRHRTYTVFAHFFSILAAEKSGCVKYADFFCGGLDLGFILV